MKNMYESILSSTKSGKQYLLEDPDAFAKEYLHLTDNQYFVLNNFLFVTGYPGKMFVIDAKFPDIKFKIGQFGGVTDNKIVIKDFSVFRKHFEGSNKSRPRLGFKILNTANTTYIQDPEFVSTDPKDFDKVIEGNLVIDKAKKIQWFSFPDIDGDITFNAKGISELSLPMGTKTNIIKIKGRK